MEIVLKLRCYPGRDIEAQHVLVSRSGKGPVDHDSQLWIDFENLEVVFVHIILTSLQRTPSFATVGQEDLSTGVGPIHADEREWNSRNLSVHGVPQRSGICIGRKFEIQHNICIPLQFTRGFCAEIGRAHV